MSHVHNDYTRSYAYLAPLMPTMYKNTCTQTLTHTCTHKWGGTKVEEWVPADSTDKCGHKSSGNLYNAMIVPYSVG